MYCAHCEDIMAWVDAAWGPLGCSLLHYFKFTPKSCGKSIHCFLGCA